MEYADLMNQMAEHWNMSPAQLENVMGDISYHESKNDATIHQTSGGPGRGPFQFEIGNEQGGATASNRLINYLKKQKTDIPDWLQTHIDSSGKVKSIDASTLTPEQQKMLFLGNYRMHPEASLSGINDDNVHEFWGKYHWAGAAPGTPEYHEKIQSFNDSQNHNSIMNSPSLEEAAFRTGGQGGIDAPKSIF